MTDVSLVVAFGTDMGNAEDAAMTFAEGVADIGIDVSARELNQVDLAELRDATHFVVVCSTFGEGEFPDNALLFWEALSAADAVRLDHLSFAVLALGDTSYESFCNAGKLLDTRLEELGATRLTDRVDVDGFYEQPAAAWTTDVVKLLQAELGTAEPPAVATTVRPDRDRGPVAARLAVNRRLNHPDSDKEVRHYEIDLAATGITYRAGDSLAVHATNDPVLVAALLQRFRVGPDHRVADHDAPLGVLLAERWEIRTPSRALQALVAARTTNADAATGLATGDALTPGAYAYGRDVLDLLALADLDLDEVVDTMRPLQSRDYSIASSPLVHPDRVHLTVATVRYARGERRHGGVASTFLADRGERLRVQLRPNNAFRLPAPDVPIIMVGPGTGIAPFRAFLQERRATAATGPSWLFFGDRRRATDYLYGDDLDGFVADGTLSRLDLAFSRDRADGHKVYVQHLMAACADELFGWLSDGAHLYVCGDERHMARDVDAALRAIVSGAGGLTADDAHAYVNDLIKTHRYVRDVY
ncbi:diflavin oxidoreductase [Mycolicibacterium grossiae]|uniref:assimilatory sulfite reductase (NADPH) n=1 Tax=Mycolicibacterium grossiae TaxID=1552759 RepID=A0A1E8QAQ1_9MYCO|nr:sulfite reductase flavoprotein subunit alpha [Mycolicibacterium grossiae]OFJ55150.1 sulfite reductase subunit alpha [Mycolicibacterium grossiae]QEM46062.1 sulfite reductase flavoprotein subunit alpha [Mycolicibacterium grossiae]